MYVQSQLATEEERSSRLESEVTQLREAARHDRSRERGSTSPPGGISSRPSSNHSTPFSFSFRQPRHSQPALLTPFGAASTALPPTGDAPKRASMSGMGTARVSSQGLGDRRGSGAVGGTNVGSMTSGSLRNLLQVG